MEIRKISPQRKVFSVKNKFTYSDYQGWALLLQKVSV